MFMGAGVGLLFLVFGAIGIAAFVLPILAAIDASKYPEWAFQQTSSSKFVWQVLPIILLIACWPAGGVLGLLWYTSKRHEVERAALAGGPPPYYGVPPNFPPPPTWPQPPPGSWGPPPAPPQVPPPAPPAEPSQ
jgi:hypothetical protein